MDALQRSKALLEQQSARIERDCETWKARYVDLYEQLTGGSDHRFAAENAVLVGTHLHGELLQRVEEIKRLQRKIDEFEGEHQRKEKRSREEIDYLKYQIEDAKNKQREIEQRASNEQERLETLVRELEDKQKSSRLHATDRLPADSQFVEERPLEEDLQRQLNQLKAHSLEEKRIKNEIIKAEVFSKEKLKNKLEKIAVIVKRIQTISETS